jgi:membrane associated rhomboid family serine protease
MLFEPHEDFRPVMWLRGHPLFVTHVIVLAYVVTMLVAALAGPAAIAELSAWLGFSSELVHRGQVWRLFTYGLVNPPSLWFVVDMLIIVWFGRELERFFGRKVFIRFYAALYLLTPVVFTLLGFFRPLTLVGETGGFALFIAFATLYPGAVMLFNILAKWLAIIAVSLYSLLHLYARDFVGLTALWITLGFAHGFVRHEQGRLALPKLTFPSFRQRPKLRVLPRPAPRAEIDLAEITDDAASEVDALLDKIARDGLASLTPAERARLEKAREDLMRRETR